MFGLDKVKIARIFMGLVGVVTFYSGIVRFTQSFPEASWILSAEQMFIILAGGFSVAMAYFVKGPPKS